MAVDLALDPLTNDLILENNQLVTIDGLAVVGQRLNVRFNMHRGEWPLDIDLGVPWREVVFVRPANDAVISALFRSVILGTPDVISLLAFELARDDVSRLLGVDFEALAEGGVLTVTGLESGIGAIIFGLTSSAGPPKEFAGILAPSVGSF